MIDRLLFAAALLAACGTALFIMTRRTCPWCRATYDSWRHLQHHIKHTHNE